MIGEEDFSYENVDACNGEIFGYDDAVFVCDEPLGSVEVKLVAVTYDDGIPAQLEAVHAGCPAEVASAARQ